MLIFFGDLVARCWCGVTRRVSGGGESLATPPHGDVPTGCHMTQSQIAQLANAVRWGHMTPDAALSKARAAGSEKSLRRALGL